MLTINPTSEKLIKQTAKNLPQSLLINGKYGVGVNSISMHISNLLSIKPNTILPEKDEKIDIENGIISVEIIRKLYNFTKIKSINKQIYIIQYADRMTIQAQNAFLKLLEEPSDSISFILTSNSISKLLPTILSRVEIIDIKAITKKQSVDMLDKLNITDEKTRIQILFIASGLPEEMTKLATNSEYFQLQISIMSDAKKLLNSAMYEKLKIAQKYKDDRKQTLNLLNYASKILQSTISAKYEMNAIKKIDKVLDAYNRVEANGNIRIALTTMSI